jgi:hypothetical protein
MFPQHGGIGLPMCADRFRAEFRNLLPRTPHDFLPLHQLVVIRSSCYFVIVSASAIADTSNATLKTVSDSVNAIGFNRRVQFASPFPKANYHRNRS